MQISAGIRRQQKELVSDIHRKFLFLKIDHVLLALLANFLNQNVLQTAKKNYNFFFKCVSEFNLSSVLGRLYFLKKAKSLCPIRCNCPPYMTCVTQSNNIKCNLFFHSVGPSKVILSGPQRHHGGEANWRFRCESSGSYPPAQLTWDFRDHRGRDVTHLLQVNHFPFLRANI